MHRISRSNRDSIFTGLQTLAGIVLLFAVAACGGGKTVEGESSLAAGRGGVAELSQDQTGKAFEPEVNIAPETMGSVPIRAPDSKRIYIHDAVFSRLSATQVTVIDAETFDYIGMIPTSYIGAFTLSRDKADFLVATSYWERLTRGKRTDVLEVWDSETLSFEYEIELPTKRALSVGFRGLLRTSLDGRFVFVHLSTPAMSVAIVDMENRAVVGEVPIPGCFAVYPDDAHPAAFFSICGDGTLLRIVLDETGAVVSQTKSGPFFDPDTNPAFVHTENVGNRHFFLTFNGDVLEVDLSGDEPVIAEPWSLLSDAELAEGWRPGGGMIGFAIHEATGRLFVGMHSKGYNGSHKNLPEEIWTFDLNTKSRTDKIPGHAATAITVSQDSDPVMVLGDPQTAGIIMYDVSGDVASFLRKGEALSDFPFDVHLHSNW